MLSGALWMNNVFSKRQLVPWKRDALHKSRSAAPGWQGATTEHIGHM